MVKNRNIEISFDIIIFLFYLFNTICKYVNIIFININKAK